MSKTLKEIRSEQMKHIDTMYQVKQLERLPLLDVMSRQMVADYFEVPVSKITNYCSAHSKELDDYGTIKLKTNDFVNVGYTYTMLDTCSYKQLKYGDCVVNVPYNGLCCLADTAVFNIALGLKNSNVANEIQKRVQQKEIESMATVTSPWSDKKEKIDAVAESTDVINEPSESVGSRDNEIQTFSDPEFGDIRTVVINGLPWFVGKDVAEALGYGKGKSINNAVAKHVDEDDKGVTEMMTPGGKQKITIINESGLYSLILSSKLPSAKRFKKWVTSEVLPSIRKHGAYMTPETLKAAILNPDVMIKILQNLKAEQEKNKQLTIALATERERSDGLVATNQALSNEVNQWNHNSVINALMRSYAKKRYNNQFQFAFADYYKQLKYKYHIDVKLRKTLSKTNTRLIDYIKPDEIDDALRLAVAICEENGIDTGKVINTVNSGKYIETEE